MRISAFLATLAATMAVGQLAAAQPAKMTFTLVGQSFNVTPPPGMCAPDETTAPTAKIISASAESQLVIDQMFFRCGLKAGEDTGPYQALATPKATLLLALPARAAILAQFKAAIADGSLAAAIHAADVTGAANKGIQSTTGLDLKLEGEPKFIETDDKAAYLAGVITGHVGGEERKIVMVGAMTVVKGRVFAWYLYGRDTSAPAVASMLKDAKANIAGFIADNGG